jgi:putative copper resistance protein D
MKRLLAPAGLAVLAMVAFLLTGGGAPQPSPDGLPDPGALTGWGLPVAVVFQQLLAVATVGSLMVPLLAMRTLREDLNRRGLLAVRAAARLALAWFVVTVAVIVFTVSDQLAVPVGKLGFNEFVSYAWQTSQGQSALVSAFVIAMAAIAARMSLTVRESAWALAIAYLANVPPILTGHSASSGSHDLAVIALMFHIGLMLTWAGGVVALVWHLRGDDSVRAFRRFSPLAAWCFAITFISGALSAAVRLGDFGELFASGYGWGVLAKIAVFALLGFTAFRVRRRLSADERPLSLLGFEVALLAAAVGLGVGLSRTANPVGRIYVTNAEALLGGPMPPPPTVSRLLWSFTPSGTGFMLVGLGSALYIAGIVALRRRGDTWSPLRTLSWFVGLAIAGWATFGGLGTYANVLFSAHMAAHMVIGMIVPVFLVIGAPLNLALRALPGSDVPGGQGPRQMLSGLLRSRFVRLVSHPIFAAVMFVGGLYVIYFTGLFTWLMENHLGHAFMEIHFLIAGMVYYEVLIGTSPINRISYLGRLLVLLAITPFHAFFGITMMTSSTAIGAEYYEALQRPWLTDLLHDNYVGGGISWGTGEVPMLLVAMMLVAQWFTSDQRKAKQFDRREAAKGDDTELAAYNAWLEKIGKETEGH